MCKGFSCFRQSRTGITGDVSGCAGCESQGTDTVLKTKFWSVQIGHFNFICPFWIKMHRILVLFQYKIGAGLYLSEIWFLCYSFVVSNKLVTFAAIKGRQRLWTPSESPSKLLSREAGLQGFQPLSFALALKGLSRFGSYSSPLFQRLYISSRSLRMVAVTPTILDCGFFWHKRP